MEHKVTAIPDGAPPLQIDPAVVECGFMMYPKVLVDMVPGQLNPHQVLEMNQPRFWPVVRRRTPQILIHTMCAVPKVEVSGLVPALKKVGFLDGYSIAVSGETKISLDGGATTEQLFVGFCWKSRKQQFLIIGPDNVVPGTKPWWKFW